MEPIAVALVVILVVVVVIVVEALRAFIFKYTFQSVDPGGVHDEAEGNKFRIAGRKRQKRKEREDQLGPLPTRSLGDTSI